MAEDELDVAHTREGRRTLVIVTVLNAVLAAGLFSGGILADSSSLLANGLDNTSDVAVYLLALFAMTRGPGWQARAGGVAGVMLIVLGAVFIIEAIRRAIVGAEPVGLTMMVAAVAAALVNILCLRILAHNRGGDVTLRAAWTYSTNDFLASAGVLVAGGLVWFTRSPWPDIVVGLAIAAYAIKSGIGILRDARGIPSEAPAVRDGPRDARR